MKVAVTGATGRVGHVIAAHLARAGHDVVSLGRRCCDSLSVANRRFELGGPLPDLGDTHALVHAAFSHLPGRYRGGEGDDPVGFEALNLDGTIRLFAHAKASGVARIVFLSSRAVHDGYPPGTLLGDDMPPRPASLYGRVKAGAEAALAEMAGSGPAGSGSGAPGSGGPDPASSGFAVASLRATGVYGPSVPGHPHKWTSLFAAFDAGEMLPPRIGAEIHAGDLAAAVALLLTAPARALQPMSFNASDILLDRHDLLTRYAELTGRSGLLPARSNPETVSILATDRLRQMGWRSRGRFGLRQALREMVEQ